MKMFIDYNTGPVRIVYPIIKWEDRVYTFFFFSMINEISMPASGIEIITILYIISIHRSVFLRSYQWFSHLMILNEKIIDAPDLSITLAKRSSRSFPPPFVKLFPFRMKSC